MLLLGKESWRAPFSHKEIHRTLQRLGNTLIKIELIKKIYKIIEMYAILTRSVSSVKWKGVDAKVAGVSWQTQQVPFPHSPYSI